MVSIRSLANSHMLSITFLSGLLCGAVSILPDLDHPLSLFLGIENPRFLHYWVFLIACSILFCLGTYLARLLLKAILRKDA